jgi:hypothetical protein
MELVCFLIKLHAVSETQIHVALVTAHKSPRRFNFCGSSRSFRQLSADRRGKEMFYFTRRSAFSPTLPYCHCVGIS